MSSIPYNMQNTAIVTATLVRNLITIDMLSQELAGHRQSRAVSGQTQGGEDYVRLLIQFSQLMATLKDNARQYTEVGFVALVAQSGLSIPFKNKQILSIYLKLCEYVIDYYTVSRKALEIRDTEFGDHADKRLGLLQTRAIRARSQFKTVVQALGRSEYQQFTELTALPLEDWAWDVLMPGSTQPGSTPS